jgi:haloalkane dehalogenase
MARVLLTSVVRPFGGPGEGDSVGAELFHAQVTRAQGAWSLRQVIRVWGLDLIAQNIEAPAVVLHYPSMEELERELRAAAYTHVGINFVVATFHKVRRMVELIRRVSPESRVVLGGYGTVLPDELLRPCADAICREEGVGFMRRLLGEDAERPIAAAHSPAPSTRVLGVQQPTVVGHVTAGLGCANGCDFCCTSHFFRRRYVRLASSGADIYAAMMETRRRAEREGQRMDAFALIDEDFFLYRRRAEEFLEAVRKGGEPLSIFGFGSVKGLSQFTADEVAEMGFDLVWTAVEGKRSGFAKLDGRPLEELHADLRSRGVGTLCSMIVGFPYQDEATIRAEFEDLLRLEPALVQVLIYFAFPGTPFFEQVVREGRFRPEYARDPDLRRWDGFALHVRHPHFEPPALERLQKELYREDFRRLGPSVHRLARTWLKGAETLAGSPSPLLRARAARQARLARDVLPTLGLAKRLLPGADARRRADELRAEIVRLTGAPSLRDRLASPLALVLGAGVEAAARLGVLQQPGLLRVPHRIPEDPAPAREPVMNLQGAGMSLLRRLWEDLRERIAPRDVAAEGKVPLPSWRPIPEGRGSVLPVVAPRMPQGAHAGGASLAGRAS